MSILKQMRDMHMQSILTSQFTWALHTIARHTHLSKHVKLHIVLLDKLLYLLRSARLLPPKLIAGEAEDAQLGGVLAVQLHHLGVAHSRQASLAGHIHNENYLAPVTEMKVNYSKAYSEAKNTNSRDSYDKHETK